MTKMKNIYILFAAIFLLSGCTEHFEELNTNPNNPLETSEDYVFNFVIKEAAGEYGYQSSYNITYVQRWIMQSSAVYGNSTMPPYTLFDQYRIQNLWRYYYSTLLLNCTVLEQMTDPEENPDNMNKHQVARIWKAYCFHRVTDLWGDVPYSEAWKLLDEYNEQNIKPAYDSQEDIYADLLSVLGDAVAKLDPALPFYTDDMLFDGDIDKWIKFANSFRLRLAVRSGNEMVIQEILSGETETTLISGPDESALFQYIEDQSWWSPYYEIHINSMNPTSPDQTGTSSPKISELMKKQLADSEDPRLEIYAQPIEFDNITYTGVPNLMDAKKKENQAMGMGVYTTSYIGTYFTKNPTLHNPLLSHSEVCFLRAEAALRGWSSESAQEWYEAGVTSAMGYFGIADTTAEQFLAADGAFDNSIEQIITQKWISLFLNGWESFAEYRRTGYPQLMKWDLELDGIKIKRADWIEVAREYVPGRLPYPDDEEDLNKTNYEAAVNAQGGDDYYQQVWWAKKFGEVSY